MTINELKQEIAVCFAGYELVYGAGDTNAQIMLIGEAPGKEEILQKKPFVGPAGKNLEEFLRVLELTREQIYLTNVCKFRPIKISAKGSVSNRTPNAREQAQGAELLLKEIAAVRPKLIVTLGNVPLRAVTGDKKATIGEWHAKVRDTAVHGEIYSLFALYHPASVIYNRSLKQTYDSDLAVLKEYIKAHKGA